MGDDGGTTNGLAPGAQRRAGTKGRTAKAGYFVSRCKGGLARRRKIVGRSRCWPGRLAAQSPLFRPMGAPSSIEDRTRRAGAKSLKPPTLFRPAARRKCAASDVAMPAQVSGGRKRERSSGCNCGASDRRRATRPWQRRSSLKSLPRGRRDIGVQPSCKARAER